MALKIIFMGTPDFAVPILKSIYESKHKILEVYTQPPTKKNRGLKIQNSPIHDFANKLNIPVRHLISFKDDIEIKHIKTLNPDIIIVVAYGKILPEALLKIEKVLFINIHASLLPKWRGAAPIQRAIMNMDRESGVSIMKIVPKLDSGPVLLQSKIKIFEDTTYKELAEKMSKLGGKLILDAIKLIEDKKDIFIEQNESEVSYAKKIEKSECKINWNKNANEVIAKINALNSNLGSWFEINGNRVKIIQAKEIKNKKGNPGTLLDENFTIACANNAVQILKLKKEGKQQITAEEFLRGTQIKIGQLLN
ncbi:methionyl-tRNA formyltransferase [Candidatus Pelagibacter bacterium]|nr:methionyl-tRNA formyltransferase [Candidatus Pelagibacter bacterium]